MPPTPCTFSVVAVVAVLVWFSLVRSLYSLLTSSIGDWPIGNGHLVVQRDNETQIGGTTRGQPCQLRMKNDGP